MSDDEDQLNEAFEAEQAKRVAHEQRIDELAETKKDAEDPERAKAVRLKLKKLREEARQNGVDSDDDAEKEDEAMEGGDESDHDEKNSDPPEGESDKEDSDSESAIARLVAIKKREKKERFKMARKFVEDSAALSDDENQEAKKLLKDLKKKHGKKATLHDAESEREETEYDREFIEDDEAEMRYDTDVEEELRGKKKNKHEKASPEKPKKKTKRKRIASSDEEEEESAKEEHLQQERPKESDEAEVFDTDDRMIENMVAVEKENAANRKSAKFHEHADIAKATADKKSKLVDIASLLNSPEKPKKPTAEKKSKNSPANKGSKKKSKAEKPTWQVDDEPFQLGKTAYKVTHRGKDFPMVKGNNGARSFDQTFFDITYLTTCNAQDPTEEGTYRATNNYDMFFVNKETKPKKVPPSGALTMWELFVADNHERAEKLVQQVLEYENMREKGRLIVPPAVHKKVFSESMKDGSKWKWQPKQPKTKSAPTPTPAIEPLPPLQRQSSSQFSDRLQQSATPPASVRKAPQSGGSTKAPQKRVKTENNGNQDVGKMLKAAAASSAPSQSDADRNTLLANIWSSMSTIKSTKLVDQFTKNRSAMIDVAVKTLTTMQAGHPNKQALKDAYRKMAEFSDSLPASSDGKELMTMQKFLPSGNAHPLLAIMIFLPFLCEEAAAATRANLYED